MRKSRVPYGWKIEKLGDYCEVFSGQGAPQGEDEYCDNGTPFIKARNLEDLCNGISERHIQKVNEDVALKYKLKLFSADTIVFAKSGMSSTKNRIYKLKGKCYIVNHLACLVPRNINVDYLTYYLRFNPPSSLIVDSAYPSIRLSDIHKFEIAIPPQEEQTKIASILKKAEKAIQKRKEVDELPDKYLQSVFIEMFGDPVLNPMGWDIRSIESVLSYITSGSRGWSKYYSDRGELFITIQNVRNCNLDFSKKTFVNAPSNAEAERTKVKSKDLLISITADLGRTAVVDEKTAQYGAYINQHLALLRLDDTSVNPIFAAYCIESKFGKSQIERFNQSAVKAGLNFNLVKKIQLCLPPLKLQDKFAEIVEKVEKLKQNQKKSAEELDTLYNSLMQKAFRGELTAGDANFADRSEFSIEDLKNLIKLRFWDKEFTYEELILTINEKPQNLRYEEIKMALFTFLKKQKNRNKPFLLQVFDKTGKKIRYKIN